MIAAARSGGELPQDQTAGGDNSSNDFFSKLKSWTISIGDEIQAHNRPVHEVNCVPICVAVPGPARNENLADKSRYIKAILHDQSDLATGAESWDNNEYVHMSNRDAAIELPNGRGALRSWSALSFASLLDRLSGR